MAGPWLRDLVEVEAVEADSCGAGAAMSQNSDFGVPLLRVVGFRV